MINMSIAQINPEALFYGVGHFITLYGVRLIGAVIFLIVGFWLANKFSKLLSNVMERRGFDASLRGFMKSLVNIALKVLVVISILSLIGIPMTSFIAILAAAGLAIGLALSGTLQNFAGGVLILIIKPFKTGDFIEAQGFMGTVSEIQIFNTILTTIDNVVVIIPNGGLATGPITNYSLKDTRRAQWVFGMAYGENFPKAQKVLKRILEEDSRVLKDPAPMIFLSELNDSSVDITVRAWAKSSEFWPMNFDIREKVYAAFAKEGITIPFPQMDVHLHRNGES